MAWNHDQYLSASKCYRCILSLTQFIFIQLIQKLSCLKYTEKGLVKMSKILFLDTYGAEKLKRKKRRQF